MWVKVEVLIWRWERSVIEYRIREGCVMLGVSIAHHQVCCHKHGSQTVPKQRLSSKGAVSWYLTAQTVGGGRGAWGRGQRWQARQAYGLECGLH